ncbi:hypothetical protein EVB41_028 [Rhizobium phage RHph_TM3_14A]|nr:hypothetical protein EVB29_028 [Rhizobium phage RHph_TM27A]QIG66948.1 hypothetical protein EVB30_028 [Rhizobium phage RHph_TM27B]QIG67038.1 hypothetical protein EVB31_028 [Rhizobium phage RHph_TM29]QIG67493.1 hypothetical protein EVB41_028 [Rhizobium phage RHph_TM3_14A]
MSEVENTVAETPAHLKNDKRFGDLMKQVTKFGEEASLGRDSLPKLALAVVHAASDGVLDLETKDSKGNDAAAQIYEKYAAAESKKAIHEHSAGGKKANISKLRQLIGMGCMTTIDAKVVMQDAYDAREGMKREEGVKVKSAYAFYVDVAREQLKSKAPLDKRALEELACKEEPKAKELEAELKRVHKILEGLVTGENRDKLRDADELTEAAMHAIKERLDKMATLRLRDEYLKRAAALGIQV